jgi:hypothetical protein
MSADSPVVERHGRYRNANERGWHHPSVIPAQAGIHRVTGTGFPPARE